MARYLAPNSMGSNMQPPTFHMCHMHNTLTSRKSYLNETRHLKSNSSLWWEHRIKAWCTYRNSSQEVHPGAKLRRRWYYCKLLKIQTLTLPRVHTWRELNLQNTQTFQANLHKKTTDNKSMSKLLFRASARSKDRKFKPRSLKHRQKTLDACKAIGLPTQSFGTIYSWPTPYTSIAEVNGLLKSRSKPSPPKSYRK